MMTQIQHGTNLNRVAWAIGRDMVRDTAVSMAHDAGAPDTPPETAIAAFSIAANTGIVFA